MKIFVLILISTVLLILDTSFLPFFSFDGFYSSLLTVCFFVYCVNNEKYNIVLFSLFTGFLQDVAFYNGFGINILLNLIGGVVLYFISVKCNRNRKFIYILIISFMTVLKSLSMVMYAAVFFGINFNVMGVVCEFIHAFLLSLFMYPMFNSIFNSKIFKKVLEF